MTLSRQIACADLILLNKVDLVPESEIVSVEETIRGINPVAPIHRTINAQIDPKVVIGIGAYHSLPPQLFDSIPGPSVVHTIADPKDHQEHREFEHEHTYQSDHNEVDHSDHAHHHYTAKGISSLQISCPPLDSPARLNKLDEWIRTLLWENRLLDHTKVENEGDPSSLQILRCKGIFRMHSGEEYVLQGVRNIYDLHEAGFNNGASSEMGKVVFIGKGLDENVKQSFQAIFSA
jgi:G3E family GTPase